MKGDPRREAAEGPRESGRGIHQGDLVAIMSAGAYGMVMASNYNSHPFPAEVLVRGGRFAVVRQRQHWEDLVREEVDPAW